jgi:hypothetical protein
MTINVLQTDVPDQQVHRTQIATTVNEILKGRANNAGSLTLTANTTTTTVSDNRFNSDMVPLLMPTSANAAAALSTTYVSARVNGSFTLTHANAATLDRTFLYVRWG